MKRLLVQCRNLLLFLAYHPWFFVRWACSVCFPYRYLQSIATRHRTSHSTDVIYCGTFKPDAQKDLIALRTFHSGLHITALLAGSSVHPGKFFTFRLCDRVVFWNSHDELLQQLRSTKATTLLFQGGDDHAMAPIVCQWSGRLVWQVRESHLRIPRQYVDREIYCKAVSMAERSDAMVSFHRKEAWEGWKDSVHFRSMPHSIPPLCIPEMGPKKRLQKLSEKDGEIHIIYAGGLNPVGGTVSHGILFTHADFYEKFRCIVEQGIHLHVYTPHTNYYSTGYKEYFDLARRSSYFHLEQTIPFEQLLVEFTRYDWAIMHVTWQLNLFNPGFEYPIQNGLMGPIQSGIPIIVSPTAKGNAEFVEKYQRGLVVAEDDVPRLKDLLRENSWLPTHCQETALEPELLYDVEAFGRAVLPS